MHRLRIPVLFNRGQDKSGHVANLRVPVDSNANDLPFVVYVTRFAQ